MPAILLEINIVVGPSALPIMPMLAAVCLVIMDLVTIPTTMVKTNENIICIPKFHKLINLFKILSSS
jgi:hypothetical protein